MSNFDNFDIDQMPSQFAQRSYFVSYFYCKKIYMIGSLDNAENAKRNFFLTTLFQLTTQDRCRKLTALWNRSTKNPAKSTGRLVLPFACLLAPLVRLLCTTHFACTLLCDHLFAGSLTLLTRSLVGQ